MEWIEALNELRISLKKKKKTSLISFKVLESVTLCSEYITYLKPIWKLNLQTSSYKMFYKDKR